MAWRRLYITVEGQTERKFADEVLRPHLAQYSLDARTRVVLTNRTLGKRGGVLDFARIRDDLRRLMREDGNDDALFTTMVDLYALPAEFPGWDEARKKTVPLERVSVLEEAFRAEMGDGRFHPYIQLHEFEALLYCDLTQLQRRIPESGQAIAALAQEVAGFAPEDINEGAATAPSKRIIRYLPIYEKTKVRIGAPAAAAIGLPTLRVQCPHFDDWVRKLEGLGEPFAG
ncbi:DUF4276 family protein [Methylocaldum sp. 14B]|jgi:hypothetical protein|uniref:DUF4276 family protein n=1 Tax=unclassified Methylocaldum TaxID=2622260 RepID=UPI00143A2A8A|nr:DUF4276 family protein [Methylocaldum sp. 14B]